MILFAVIAEHIFSFLREVAGVVGVRAGCHSIIFVGRNPQSGLAVGPDQDGGGASSMHPLCPIMCAGGDFKVIKNVGDMFLCVGVDGDREAFGFDKNIFHFFICTKRVAALVRVSARWGFGGNFAEVVRFVGGIVLEEGDKGEGDSVEVSVVFIDFVNDVLTAEVCGDGYGVVVGDYCRCGERVAKHDGEDEDVGGAGVLGVGDDGVVVGGQVVVLTFHSHNVVYSG